MSDEPDDQGYDAITADEPGPGWPGDLDDDPDDDEGDEYGDEEDGELADGPQQP